MKYKRFFDIDPEYFPQINEAIIKGNPDLWKSFYPHETFVRLMKDVISVITRSQKVSLWVEGAYGTGKSYAVLTMQKLLDAREVEVTEYFNKYHLQLDNDLYNLFIQAKNGGDILTVHRYGSSNIYGDGCLAFALQESISRALQQKGFTRSVGDSTLKNATISWLEEPANRKYFNDLMTGQYADTFSGDTADDLVNKLRNYSDQSLENLMAKVMKVANERGFTAMSLDMRALVEWIKAVIKENQLKAIVFIWDEFTAYFRNNIRDLTGFQQIADLSGSHPFYLMLVTHNAQHEFPENSQDFRRISGRFLQPFCQITMPENIAFRLMGAAMVKDQDPTVQNEWQAIVDDLYNRTCDSRQLVKQKARISDAELQAILPIHPYAALLLKFISSTFASNQRSMFDFIKNDRGEDVKGFQWFIYNRGPYEDDNPLLTIDLLWNFFYKTGRDHLSVDIRAILDTYPRVKSQLDGDQRRVLKAVLLLQAISQRAGDSVELFIANEKNINNAFEGSALENGAASRIADTIARVNILHKDTTQGKNIYSALVNAADTVEIERLKEKHRQTSTAQLLIEGEMDSAITLSGALKLRYATNIVTASTFRQKINQLRNQENQLGNRITAVYCLAKDDLESIALGKLIADAITDGSFQMVFVDASPSPLGYDLLEQYVDAKANAEYQSGKDNRLAAQYDATAKDALRKWRSKVSNGDFVLYSADKITGERFHSMEDMTKQLMAINRRRYPTGLETMGTVIDGMWSASNLPAGVQCGATQTTSGPYRSANPQTKLEHFINDAAWQAGSYWESHPHLPISQMKLHLERIIKQHFESSGRVSIATIYNAFQEAPFGFMPCNLTAFVLGFLLKEYVSGAFTYSDGLTNDALDVDKLKDMLSDIIRHQNTPIPRYRDKYIVTMTQEEKAFNDAASKIFGIQRNQCTSLEQTREHIRKKMKDLSFPIWTLKSILKDATLHNDVSVVAQLIDGFSGIANSQNFGSSKSDNDIAQSIGRLCLAHENLVEDLQPQVNREHCTKGMEAYLLTFEGGALQTLSEEVGDDGQYINFLRKKFDADAANWVWNVETAQTKIREVILDYRIISVSNKILPRSRNFDSTVREWMDACSNIRLSHLYASNYWEDLSPLMEMLFQVKRSGALLEAQKARFLEQIQSNGTAFNAFYINQEATFSKACTFLLTGLQDGAVSTIFRSLPTNMFTLEKQDYQQRIESAVSKYKDEQDTLRLKALWSQKTGSDSPSAWSSTYHMPILAMLDEVDIIKGREAFETLQRRNPDKASVDRTIAFLEHADFFIQLKDKQAREKAFISNVIKDFRVMLSNVGEVQNHLSRALTLDPYDWYMSPEVEKQLRQMAEAKYNQSGSSQALEVIDSMDIQEVKRYLKELIRNNMVVGMEIIKGRRN